MKSSLGPFAHGTEWPVQESNFGSSSDWTGDNTTVHYVRFEWTSGELTVTSTGGTKSAPSSVTQGQWGDQRYFFIGCDRTYNKAMIGARFLSATIEDYSTSARRPAAGGVLSSAQRRAGQRTVVLRGTHDVLPCVDLRGVRLSAPRSAGVYWMAPSPVAASPSR